MVNNKLKVISILSFLLLIPIALYFKYFPTIININISNLFIFSLIFLLICFLVYGSFIIQKPEDVYFLIPQSLMFTFLARAIPNLRLPYPPLHDPYYHFVCTLNVIEYGTLKPILGWWYEGTEMQLRWPDMQLITTALVKITNIDVMQFFRFQEPFMGMAFFLAVFLLTKTITKNNGVALLAGLFASINDVIIFYQSEYHPQGISIVYFVLLLYAFIKSRKVCEINYRYVSIIFGAVFILSHYFTPLFLSLIFSSYIVMMLLTRFFLSFKSIQIKYANMFENLTLDYGYFTVVIIASLSYHFFVYSQPLKTFIEMASRPVQEAHLISVGQVGRVTIPVFTSIVSSCKWGLFILAIISLFYIIRTKNKDEFCLGSIMVCIIFAGIVGNYIISSPLDRLIGFYVIFAAIFASLTLNRFNNGRFGGISYKKNILLSVIIASLIITAGFLNAQTPTYFFKDSKINSYYWYSNTLPPTNEYQVAGDFINKINNNSFFYVNGEAREITFYFGGLSEQNFIQSEKFKKDEITNYVKSSSNKFIVTYVKELLKGDPYKSLNKIYTTDKVRIFT